MSFLQEIRDNQELNSCIRNSDYLVMRGNDNSTTELSDFINSSDLSRLSALILFSVLLARESRVAYSSIADSIPQMSYLKKLGGAEGNIVSKGIILADRFCKGDDSLYGRIVGFSYYSATIISEETSADSDIFKQSLYDWGKLAFDNLVGKIASRGSNIKYNPYFGEPTKLFKGMDIDLRIDGSIYNITFGNYSELAIDLMVGAYNCNHSKHNKYKLNIGGAGLINLSDLRVDIVDINIDTNLVNEIDNCLDNILDKK